MSNQNQRGSSVGVLDHGLVRLVDFMGDDLSIVRAARVSYDADWRSGQDEGKDAKLIHYLMKNRHTTPFEAVTFTFEVKAPIFVLRQWHRHRTWSYNEVSARYTELGDEYYVPLPEHIGQQATDDKQARKLLVGGEPSAMAFEASTIIEVACREAWQKYQMLLARGVPRELARSVLPVTTYSRMFATVNLHNLLHFIELRSDAHAQFEIREYARALRELAHCVVPVTMEAWRELRKPSGPGVPAR